MTPEQFCYWLKGRAELQSTPISPAEWQCIKEHLDLVFRKMTPPGPGDRVTLFPEQPQVPGGVPIFWAPPTHWGSPEMQRYPGMPPAILC